MKLEEMTTEDLRKVLDGEPPVVVLLPVGSVEPHGPHLPLGTDTLISEAACLRTIELMSEHGLVGLLAPPIPYGVTECADGFAGAISVAAETLTAMLRDVAGGYLAMGASHVCLVNNHLEPAHDKAVRAAGAKAVSVACPLTRRWARTLTSEFKSGACHAGQYETSIIMEHRPDLVRDQVRQALADVDISLSEGLAAGKETFLQMGLEQAYAGSPKSASKREGRDTIEKLAVMILTEVQEAL